MPQQIKDDVKCIMLKCPEDDDPSSNIQIPDSGILIGAYDSKLASTRIIPTLKPFKILLNRVEDKQLQLGSPNTTRSINTPDMNLRIQFLIKKCFRKFGIVRSVTLRPPPKGDWTFIAEWPTGDVSKNETEWRMSKSSRNVQSAIRKSVDIWCPFTVACTIQKWSLNLWGFP